MEALTRTEVAQPALFCVSLAVSDAARARGLQRRLRRGPLARRVHGRSRLWSHLGRGRDRARLPARPADGRDRRRAAGRHGRGDRARGRQAVRPVRAGVGHGDGHAREHQLPHPDRRLRRGGRRRQADGAGRRSRCVARREAPGRRRLPQRADEAGAGSDGRGRPRRRLVGSPRPGRLEFARRARERRGVASGRARRADRQPRALGRVRAGAGRRRRGQVPRNGPRARARRPRPPDPSRCERLLGRLARTAGRVR